MCVTSAVVNMLQLLDLYHTSTEPHPCTTQARSLVLVPHKHGASSVENPPYKQISATKYCFARTCSFRCRKVEIWWCSLTTIRVPSLSVPPKFSIFSSTSDSFSSSICKCTFNNKIMSFFPCLMIQYWRTVGTELVSLVIRRVD